MIWGLDIGGTKTAFLTGTREGKVLSRTALATADYPHWETLLTALLPAPGESETPEAIGISCGGPLDSASGRILSPPNLPGWDDVPICDWLTARYGVHAYLQNDANACALAEWKFGAGQGTKNMAFLTFGTGLGAGLILDGKLYSGTNDQAGELGHVRLAETGPVGYYKTGSVEGFCSGGGLKQLAKLRLGRELTAKELCTLAREGDTGAASVIRESAGKLGAALSILVDLLNPQRIVIGSIFARAEDLYRQEMERVMQEECLALSLGVCTVVPAALGNTIGDIAALTVAVNGLDAV